MRRGFSSLAAALAAILCAWLACRPPIPDGPRAPKPIRRAPLPVAVEEAEPRAVDTRPTESWASADADRDETAVDPIPERPIERPPARPPAAAVASPIAPAARAPAVDILPPVPPARSSTSRRSTAAVLPSIIRVGLETDLERVEVPCCAPGLVAEVMGETVSAAQGLTVLPAPEARGLGVFRLQVGALQDEGQAHQLARRLGASLGGGDVVFDAASGLHKVRVGAFGDRAAADRGKRRLAELGVEGAFTVHEDHGLENAGLVVRVAGGERRVATRSVLLTRPDGPVRYGSSAYRGSIRVFLNERGRLNVINELDLESYLRGVVPMELGPALYPELEALKAQAVAARSYTARNLGRFGGDGYDICATPRCQVYGGASVEHPLSDRAVAETAGEVALSAQEPIDALYSSTCGGRTEAVSWVFPDKDEPYLSSVPCVENGVHRLGPPRGVPADLDAWLLEVTLGTISGDDREVLEERIRRLAQLVTVPRPGQRLASLERAEVRRYLASQLDLALDARLLAADRASTSALAPRERRLVETLAGPSGSLSSGALSSGALSSGALSSAEARALVVELLAHFGLLEVTEGRFLAASEGRIELGRGADAATHPLATTYGAWRFDGRRHAAGPLELAPGDPLELYSVREAVVAVVQHAAAVGPAVAVLHDRQRWTRFRSRQRLDPLVREQFPGFTLERLEVLARGDSGRVARLELVGANGRREVLAGLPIRWALDVPDTWFDLRATRSRSGEEGWLFEGRGWGHGVGMCQIGSFAMAKRGHDYREILGHYYPGVEIRRLESGAPAGSATAQAGHP